MVILDAAIVTVALPSIQEDLAFSTQGLQWVVSAYASPSPASSCSEGGPPIFSGADGSSWSALPSSRSPHSFVGSPGQTTR